MDTTSERIANLESIVYVLASFVKCTNLNDKQKEILASPNFDALVKPDIQIILSDGKISARSTFLRKNEVFDKMLSETWGANRIIHLPDDDLATMSAVVGFIEVGELPEFLSGQYSSDYLAANEKLLMAADKYLIHDLDQHSRLYRVKGIRSDLDEMIVTGRVKNGIFHCDCVFRNSWFLTLLNSLSERFERINLKWDFEKVKNDPMRIDYIVKSTEMFGELIRIRSKIP